MKQNLIQGSAADKSHSATHPIRAAEWAGTEQLSLALATALRFGGRRVTTGKRAPHQSRPSTKSATAKLRATH
jgi:hypothetical protein